MAAFALALSFPAVTPVSALAHAGANQPEADIPKLERIHSTLPAALSTTPLAASAAPMCQAAWNTFATPNASGNNELNAISAVSGTDIWAVGDSKNAAGINQTLAEHWNGSNWTIVSTPNLGAGNNLLLSVGAVASNDVWAVGLWRTNNTSPRQTLTEHWNGTTWSVVSSPNVINTSDALFSVRAVSSSNVLAVGRAKTSTTIAQPLVEQWNGTSWNILPTPATTTSFSELIALTVISPTNVWAVGDQSNDGVNFTTLTEQWNGASWTIVASPNSTSGFGGFLLGVAGTAASDVWAVGAFTITGGQDQTLVEHWNGTAWSVVPSPPFITGTNTPNSDLISVAALSSTNVWAVGANFGSTGDWTLIEHWDGTAWSTVGATQPGVISNDLFDIAAISPSEMWTVGRDINVNPNVVETAAQNYCVPPSVSTIAPTSGPATGGTVVTITGIGFSWATGVNFGGTPAASFTVNSDTQITATSPQEQAGTVDVKITYFLGPSQPVPADQFTVTATVPQAPSNVVARGGEASAAVSWAPPPFNGGTAITGYALTTTPPTTSTVAPAGATSAQVTGLTDGTTYTVTVAATNSVGTGPGTASNPVTPGRGQYHPLAPARILDTRDGTGGVPVAPLGPNSAMNAQITGQGGVPATGVAAVVINVTVTNTTAPSYLTVWPAGLPRPLASNLNFVAGQSLPNLVEVAVGPNGQVSIYNAFGKTDVIFDVAGYVATPTATPGPDGLENPVVPFRLLDTRNGTGAPPGPVGPQQTITVSVTGVAGSNVPAGGVAAVVLNITVTSPTAASYLTVFPTGSAKPVVSNLNFVAGQTVPNRVIVKVGTGGMVSIYNAFGSAHVIADVGGWFTDGVTAITGSRFLGVTPARILDTRDGTGGVPVAPLGPNASMMLTVAGRGGVPDMTAATPPVAVVLNVTVTRPTAASYLTVWPDGASRPLASDLNYGPGLTVPNLVVVKLGSNGLIDLYNAFGSTDVIIDVMGWYG